MSIYLDKGTNPGTEVSLLSYSGDAIGKANGRYRGTFIANDLVLERDAKYWVRIERKRTVQGENSFWLTNSGKQESIDSGWDIGGKYKYADGSSSWNDTGTSRGVIRLAVLGDRALTAERLTLWYYECPMGMTRHWIYDALRHCHLPLSF